MGMDEMNCGTCGSSLSDADEVCARCGTPVPARSRTVGKTEPESPPAPELRPATAAGSAQESHPAPAEPAPTALSDQSRTIASNAPAAAQTAVPAPETRPAPVLTPLQQDELESLLRQAHVHLRRRNIDAARDLAKQAAVIAPDYSVTHEMLGLVLEADGDDLGAYREYRAACETKPAPPEAEERLAKLTLRLPPETVALLQPPALTEKALPASAEARLPPEVRATLASAALAPPPRARRAGASPFASLLLPGLGQWLNRDYIKSVVMFVVWLGCIAFIEPFIYANVKNPKTGQMSDPALWFAVVILIIDYLMSVADAGMAGGDQGR